jgi:uncharacterized SAM-binding protein YcdF (DUF218 family)
MSVDLIIFIAAIAISILVFTWLVKVVKATLSTAFAIALILLAAQIVFGIGPADLWQQGSEWLQSLWQSLRQPR